MRTNQSLGLGRNIISVVMLTGHCVMDRYAERMSLPFNDFCRGCKFVEEEETFLRFLCQCPPYAICRYRLFGSSFLIRFTELLSIDIRDIALFIKLSVAFD